MSQIPVRIAHAWAIAWLDLYQTPAIITESVTSEISGFFRNLVKKKDDFPNTLNPQTVKLNRLGRKRRYGNEDKSFIFGNPY